jgi:adenosylhomocysteine nucleosidase
MGNEQSTLVCFALKEEAGPFRRATAGRPHLAVLLTGIGRSNAERRVRDCLSNQSPSLVLTCGFAGGLNPQLRIGDVVFHAADPALKSALANAGAAPAGFSCAARIAVTAAEKAELRRTTQADAVEMESAAIHEVCREHNIPCATVRVISDTADEDLPLDFNALQKPGQDLDFARLAAALLRQPGKIPALLRLQKNCRLASQRLSDVLTRLVDRG